MAKAELAVRGLADLTKTFDNAPKDVKRAYRKELRTIGDPTRTAAERLATSKIPRNTPAWEKMRVGVTQTLVYVAPRKRGIKGRGFDQLRRPRFGTLLMDRAMQPALDQHHHQIEHDFDRMLDRLVTKWDHDGP